MPRRRWRGKTATGLERPDARRLTGRRRRQAESCQVQVGDPRRVDGLHQGVDGSREVEQHRGAIPTRHAEVQVNAASNG